MFKKTAQLARDGFPYEKIDTGRNDASDLLAGWTPGGGSSLAQHVTEDLALDVANDGWVVTGDVHLHNSHGFETRLLANPLTRWANIIGTNWSCYFLGNINGGWAVLQYMSCWDWVGMKFKTVAIPNPDQPP